MEPKATAKAPMKTRAGFVKNLNAGSLQPATGGHVTPAVAAPHGLATAPGAAAVIPIRRIEGIGRVRALIIGIVTEVKRKGPQKAWAERLAGLRGGKCRRQQQGDGGEQSKDSH